MAENCALIRIQILKEQIAFPELVSFDLKLKVFIENLKFLIKLQVCFAAVIRCLPQNRCLQLLFFDKTESFSKVRGYDLRATTFRSHIWNVQIDRFDRPDWANQIACPPSSHLPVHCKKPFRRISLYVTDDASAKLYVT